MHSTRGKYMHRRTLQTVETTMDRRPPPPPPQTPSPLLETLCELQAQHWHSSHHPSTIACKHIGARTGVEPTLYPTSRHNAGNKVMRQRGGREGVVPGI